MAPILVYLDNNDYSRLSDLDLLEGRFAGVLEKLMSARSDKVIYCFSGTMLSEISPLAPAYSDAANRRAEALVSHCGRNALISIDRLIDAEIKALLGSTASPPPIWSPTGDWFPSNIEAFSPVKQFELAAQVRDSIKTLAPNRKARRFAEAKALKGQRVTAPMKRLLVSGAREGTLNEILRSYPMRPEDARVLARFAVGDATVQEANEAFVETLRDPRWMMSWFEQHHGEHNSFITGVRAPAESLANTMRQFAANLKLFRESQATSGTSDRKLRPDVAQWKKWQDQFLVGLATRLARVALGSEPPPITSMAVDEKCPGLSVGIRSLLSAWHSALTETTPRPPGDSDFPDSVHAMYAPYVQIFRADRFMAPHIRKHAAKFGTSVVPKLEDLPTVIEHARSIGRSQELGERAV